jgi:hypothetical protein
LASSYAALTVDEKNAISDSSYLASELQSNVGSVLDRAVERYDYVLAKYGTANYANFLNRDVVVLPSAFINGLSETNRITNSIVAILVVSLSSLTFIASSVFLKRKREE